MPQGGYSSAKIAGDSHTLRECWHVCKHQYNIKLILIFKYEVFNMKIALKLYSKNGSSFSVWALHTAYMYAKIWFLQREECNYTLYVLHLPCILGSKCSFFGKDNALPRFRVNQDSKLHSV